MADQCDEDNVQRLFDACNAIFEDEPASEVMYVIGMLIANGIKKNCINKNPEVTFDLLRETVELEMKM